ncbi:Inosine-uridine preferring nucleoside hydrolase [Sphingobium sp. AP50]|uniref:nucleoside hydrolase n=1 Tax=Sphingobium sp. AP50 TaxID=1884369 RepID=UPI0008BC4C6A|nr:nucleoside hydrolase [Sphingobium sp. AP50]SEK07404.1 Inosine-uridine preferring nucleoside hydrolase [Sphingobium sp. AP50]
MNRRQLITRLSASGIMMGMTGTMAAAASVGRKDPPPAVRSRVLFANDLCGNADGLFAAVHAILSTASMDLRGIIGTGTNFPNQTAKRSVGLAQDMLAIMGRSAQVPVFMGATSQMKDDITPVRSAGTQAIIDEAKRTDTKLPLYIAVGGGLTEVASALLLEPEIAGKFTLVWIGGGSFPAGGFEFNAAIDPVAFRYVFNQSEVAIWQVPADAYDTCHVSISELRAYIQPCGPIGKWLMARLSENIEQMGKMGLAPGSTWILGDSPLVLLTALTDNFPSSFKAPFTYDKTASSTYSEIFVPRILNSGAYQETVAGRKMRMYRKIDTRLMFGDMFAKFKIQGI